MNGMYDMDLSWTPDSAPPGAPVDPNGPSIFTAIEEQLGLKLQPGIGSMQTLIIDSVEHPTQN